MMGNYWRMGSFNYGWSLLPWFIPLMLLDLVLRGYALWRAGQRGQKWWFVALLIVNSVGILPLIYLLIYRDTKQKK